YSLSCPADAPKGHRKAEPGRFGKACHTRQHDRRHGPAVARPHDLTSEEPASVFFDSERRHFYNTTQTENQRPAHMPAASKRKRRHCACRIFPTPEPSASSDRIWRRAVLKRSI